MGNCANNEGLLNQIKQVSDLLNSVDLKSDLDAIEKVLGASWELYQHLNKNDKQKVHELSTTYFRS